MQYITYIHTAFHIQFEDINLDNTINLSCQYYVISKSGNNFISREVVYSIILIFPVCFSAFSGVMVLLIRFLAAVIVWVILAVSIIGSIGNVHL